MTIEINELIERTSQALFGSNAIQTVLSSELVIGFIIVLIVLVIALYCIPFQDGVGFLVVMKVFLYSFAATLLLLYLHSGVQKYQLTKNKTGGGLLDPNISDFYSSSFQPIPDVPQPVQPFTTGAGRQNPFSGI